MKHKNEESPSELSSSDLLHSSSSSSSSASSSDKPDSSEERNIEQKQNNNEEVDFVRFKKQNDQEKIFKEENNNEDQDEGNDANNQFTSPFHDQYDPDEDDDGEIVKGIKLFNIFESGNNTDWHCLISVRPPVSYSAQLNAPRLFGEYPSNIEREGNKQHTFPFNQTSPNQFDYNDPQHILSPHRASADLFIESPSIQTTQNSPSQTFSYPSLFLSPELIFAHSTIQFNAIDGDTTVPCICAANDMIGAVARFEIRGTAHVEILMDKRLLNIIACVLNLPLHHPNVF
ncbi:MAG: hypothetical protein EZS28_016969 [Streblomastix strix]|uniref:Uncharacterized protein n=1 Tax=Streblomastix strix TaxID=222440 RepID=A0A5J4VY35_9EUKA|nr:MAG: hypothetical protein EZS28_016968 [Streblomastix strix]KAA6387505.1 MAG: hypothetical protein EZS28_016969 [Streblomastix strix]